MRNGTDMEALGNQVGHERHQDFSSLFPGDDHNEHNNNKRKDYYSECLKSGRRMATDM